MRHASPYMSGPPGRPDGNPLQSGLHFARPDALSPGLTRISAIILSFLGMALMLISLQPFAVASLTSEATLKSGSVINQVGFVFSGFVFVLAVMGLANRKALASLLSPSFLTLGVVLAYNLAIAPNPGYTFRAEALTVIGMLVAFATIVLPRGEKDFQIALLAGAAATLAVSYAGIVLAPDLAIHGSGGDEPQHAGLWRGHFSHKNVAGPVMCIIAFFGIYLMRTGRRFAGLIIFAAAALFVVKTGSKTTNGLFPISILIVFMAGLFGRSSVAIVAHISAVAVTAVFTLGSLYSQGISNLILHLLKDDTYTGRTTLWEFALSRIPEKPWLGFGLYNFWNTPYLLSLDKPFESPWDFRTIVHGHNNYLDILLNLGFVGGAVVFWLLFIAPVFNYAKARHVPGNRKLADMFFMIIVFVSLLSFLETFFLARNSALWLMHAFAVFGLHLLARFSIAQSSHDR